VFERFTNGARQAITLAEDESRNFGHDFIGTEHILLGLLREEGGLAARVLASLGFTLEELRVQVGRAFGFDESQPAGQIPSAARAERTVGRIPFTREVKRVLQLSVREARELNHDYVGTEHVLLGLVRLNDRLAISQPA
jgi:ATP-dependent Clp protease ATP-binding subunit ClpC